MTGRGARPADPLRRLVARLARPEAPHALAARIVARATIERQQPRRAAVLEAVARAAPSHRFERAIAWRPIALTGAAAAAAVSLMLMAPAARIRPATHPVALARAPVAPPAPEGTARHPARAQAPVVAAVAHRRGSRPPAERMSETVPAQAALPAALTVAQADVPQLAAGPAAPLANDAFDGAQPVRLAGAVGPAAPVQGPGIHDGLAPFGRDGAGLGVAGGPADARAGASRDSAPARSPGPMRR